MSCEGMLMSWKYCGKQGFLEFVEWRMRTPLKLFLSMSTSIVFPVSCSTVLVPQIPSCVPVLYPEFKNMFLFLQSNYMAGGFELSDCFVVSNCQGPRGDAQLESVVRK